MKTIPETGEKSGETKPLLFDEIGTDVAACFPAPLADEGSFLDAWNEVRRSGRIFKIDRLARRYLSEIADRKKILPFEYINDDLILGASLPGAAFGSAECDSFFIEFDASDHEPTERCGTLFCVRRIEQADEDSIAAARALISRAQQQHTPDSGRDPGEQAWMTAMHGALTLGDASLTGALWHIRKKSVTHSVTAYPLLKLRHEKQPRVAFVVWHFALSENSRPEPEMFSYPTETHRNRWWFEEVERGSRINCLTPCLLGWHVVSQAADAKRIENNAAESAYYVIEHDDWRKFNEQKWPELIG